MTPAPKRAHRVVENPQTRGRYWTQPNRVRLPLAVFRNWGEVIYQSTFKYPPHTHQDYEAILVVRGHYQCLLNGQCIAVKPGEVVVVAPGDIHEDGGGKGLVIRSLQWQYLKPGSSTSWRVLISKIDPKLQVAPANRFDGAGFFSRLETESLRGDGFSFALQEAITSEFFYQYLRQMPPALLEPEFLAQTGEADFRLRVATFFQANLKSPLRPKIMAQALVMPERTFHHRCRQYFGESPLRLFTRFRLEQAREYLESSRLSVSAVSDALGFANAFHFSRSYKRVFGESPSQVRNR